MFELRFRFKNKQTNGVFKCNISVWLKKLIIWGECKTWMGLLHKIKMYSYVTNNDDPSQNCPYYIIVYKYGYKMSIWRNSSFHKFSYYVFIDCSEEFYTKSQSHHHYFKYYKAIDTGAITGFSWKSISVMRRDHSLVFIAPPFICALALRLAWHFSVYKSSLAAGPL